jgi:hypothetical protein
MKRFVITSALATLAFAAAPVHADDMFTGDVKTACEVILCLSSSTRPAQCTPPVRKYLSITARKMSDTIRKRKNFLKLCPAATQDPEMAALVNAISANKYDAILAEYSQEIINEDAANSADKP